jgi:thiamine biosynthesis lipoprotein
MGTWLELTVAGADHRRAVSAGESAIRAIARVEARLSTWGDSSELSRLNHLPVQQWMQLSPELTRDLSEAVYWWRYTGGAFSPAMAPLIRVWGTRTGGRQPSAPELRQALSAAQMAHLELDGDRARRLHPHFGIEEGGFAKGIGLREAANAALGNGARCVELNLGGQILRAGDCQEVEVALAHPGDRQLIIAVLSLRTGSVATSGNGVRRLLVDGHERGHILDPDSGRPTRAWGSMTVVSADPVAADCLATGLYVMGPKAGRLWAARELSPEHGGEVGQTQAFDRVVIVELVDGDPVLWTTPGAAVSAIRDVPVSTHQIQ